MPKEIVFARQPILDKDERLIGYELLFRGESPQKDEMKDMKATSSLLTGFLSSDYPSVLQGNKGFVNMDEVLIKSGAIDLLSKEDFVIEILESVEVLHVVDRLERYKKEGFTLALDDFIANQEQFDRYMEFFYLFDIVKFDIKEKVQKDLLPMIVESLKNFGIKLLAEKVETQEEYEFYKNLGFDYFQGYYFMEPQIASQKMMMPNKRALLELWSMGEDEFDKMVERLKADPELSINILRLLNSSYFNLKKEVSSVSQALVYLGMRNFKKWLLLMLYSQDGDYKANPWLDLAKSRAHFMSKAAPMMKLDGEKAYLVGILSLFSEAMGQDESKISEELPMLDEEIKRSLISYDTPYGILLQTAKRMEKGDFESWKEEFGALHIDPQELALFYSDALRSLNSL